MSIQKPPVIVVFGAWLDESIEEATGLELFGDSSGKQVIGRCAEGLNKKNVYDAHDHDVRSRGVIATMEAIKGLAQVGYAGEVKMFFVPITGGPS